ncbi:alpha-1,6-mannosylglycoprotein 6-beta-N-acetylglucosaminyltransferase A-like [Styela clava]
MSCRAFEVLQLGNRVRIFPRKIVLTVSVIAVLFLCNIFYSRHPNIKPVKSVEELNAARKEILELSIKYVKDLSNKLVEVEDGPAAYPYTGYDLKKALAVLINDLNMRVEHLSDRIQVLENHVFKDREVKEVMRNGRKDMVAVNAVDILNNEQEDCPFPSFDDWPYCESKIVWMREMWESDKCYAEWGVDGSDCTILVYLSEQERWCPPFPWRVNKTMDEEAQADFELAEIRSDFTSLFAKMGDSLHFKWIKSRISRMAPTWIEAGRSLHKKFYNMRRKRKKVLFHMGLLSEDIGWDIAKNAFSGGPLGELVQWSDLISAVYILGHDITLSKSVSDLKEIYDPYLNSASSNCPLKKTPFDILYSDIAGLRMLKKVATKKFHLLQCNIRVLDSFGTEPEFNHVNYASKKTHKSSWGKWNLNPKQFNTMFPHSPDNTFLGFVVEEHLNDTSIQDIKKENIALVYGKRDLFWQEKEEYISALHDVIEVHSTIDNKTKLENVPDYVHNHGVLPGFELHQLLRRAKIFVGLGFPYEGPAPLEAIANGAVFLNPKFSTPKNSLNTPFFLGKPTLRKLASQHPYAEMYIGQPHVQSVDMENLESLKEIVKKIINDEEEVKPYLPYEFTCGGMLERLSLYLDKQDFCSGNVKSIWPPKSALQIKITNGSQSCIDVCHVNGLICEPSYFPILNKHSTFASLNITCSEFPSTVPQTEIDYPAFLHDTCFLQSDNKLFSCAGRYTNMKRICPCRDYLQGQVALCKDCV